MTFISGTPLTFNGKEAREGIIEQAFDKPLITAFHTVVADIVAKEQIAYLGRISKVSRTSAGCSTTSINSTVPMTEKFWDPTPIEIFLNQCYADLETTFFTWGLGKGIDRADLTNTENGYFEEFIMEILTDATFEDCLRIVWLGDKAVDEIGNSGTLLNASDIVNYNQIDGLWKQIFAGVAASTVYHHTITENSAVSFTLQDTLASDAALKAYRAITQNCDYRLQSDPDAFIITTRSLYNNYKNYLSSQNVNSSYERIEKAIRRLQFDGYDVMSFDLWDRYIRADFQNGTVWNLPHRALFTTRANLAVGFDAPEAVTSFKVWLENKENRTYMRGMYKLDAKLIHEYMTAAAY